MKAIKLTGANLSQIKTAALPSYDRKDLEPRIVHLGLGHFHRAHQAGYLEELLCRGLCRQGIFEMNLVPDSFPLRETLGAQDYLYTLMTKNPRGDRVLRVVGCITGYLNGSDRQEEAISRIASEETDLVTLTVTEGGYHYNNHTGDLLWDDPAVRQDLEHPREPATAAGYLAAALERRFKAKGAPLTILSCDNIPANGKVLRACVLSLCEKSFPEIIPWVEDRVSFPCSMVDRITPGTTPALVRELEQDFGIIDGWPVCGEDFRQWVLEDNFKTPVPPWAEGGVQIVRDVEPYELMKMRLLNGSHSALAFSGYLLGHRRVDEAMEDHLLRDFIRRRYMEEVTPTLEPVPGIDLDSYKDTLVSRFSNRNIGDTILRLASEGSSKIPNFVLKPLLDTVKGRLPNGAILLALAAWARFLQGTDEQGEAIPIQDANGPALSEAARRANPEGFLTAIGIQGVSPGELSSLAGRFQGCREEIRQGGMRGALEKFMAE